MLRCMVCIFNKDTGYGKCWEMPRKLPDGTIVYKKCVTMPLTTIVDGNEQMIKELDKWYEKTLPAD